jgi:histidyl-tRNA synthetase
MGGNPCPSVGFALGLERLILLIQEQNLSITDDPLSAYIVALGDEAQIKSLQIAEQLHVGLFFVGFFYFNKIFHICPFK